jgi:transketolase C-terminal domain/subunit
MATKLFREAIREALIEELDRNPRMFLMGEDIGRYQGTFRVTEGLFQKYGSKRVWDTPISEPGFIAIAIGAAIEGLKPVVEVMTWSFALLAFDQIVNHAAKILYKSGGACARADGDTRSCRSRQATRGAALPQPGSVAGALARAEGRAAQHARRRERLAENRHPRQ